ncbi:hypothetical protein LL033_21915 [Clostridium estertheticum]|uniref:hypothetical protein n=1 Tax=Clostridium estertheticum TaxID=238834 RepID=UPI001C0A9535|nr:hypothetical protein [Clostridium estertheticum]MBU3217536.1 hypothetical protein [Clostridium estertheticum]WAG55232.1 hypothetical protein LL033_21915 [Clostridium estertheticum]
MCIFSLSFFRVVFNEQFPINLTLTITMALVVTAVTSIVQFSIKLLDPNKLSQIEKSIKGLIEEHKSHKNVKKDDTQMSNAMLFEFMKNYNELESTIIDFAQKLDKIYVSRPTRKTKPRIIDALKILSYNQIINS